MCSEAGVAWVPVGPVPEARDTPSTKSCIAPLVELRVAVM